LRSIAERAWNLTRLFNVREGFTRKDNTLPERIFTLASTRGPSKGQVVDKKAFEKMLDEYYQIAGWDRSTGIPTKEILMELGIEKTDRGLTGLERVSEKQHFPLAMGEERQDVRICTFQSQEGKGYTWKR
jgi:hypothetical protein